MCTSVGRLRWLPVGPHLRRGVYANTSRLALLQDPAAPRVDATLEIAGVCGSGHEWPAPPGGSETAPCFDQRAMSLERGSGLGQVLLGSSRGSNECFCISPRDPHLSALSDGPAYPGTNGSVLPVYPGSPRIHVAQWRGTKLFSDMNSETCVILVESGVAAVLHHLSYSLGDVRAGATLS